MATLQDFENNMKTILDGMAKWADKGGVERMEFGLKTIQKAWFDLDSRLREKEESLETRLMAVSEREAHLDNQEKQLKTRVGQVDERSVDVDNLVAGIGETSDKVQETMANLHQQQMSVSTEVTDRLNAAQSLINDNRALHDSLVEEQRSFNQMKAASELDLQNRADALTQDRIASREMMAAQEHDLQNRSRILDEERKVFDEMKALEEQQIRHQKGVLEQAQIAFDTLKAETDRDLRHRTRKLDDDQKRLEKEADTLSSSKESLQEARAVLDAKTKSCAKKEQDLEKTKNICEQWHAEQEKSFEDDNRRLHALMITNEEVKKALADKEKLLEEARLRLATQDTRADTHMSQLVSTIDDLRLSLPDKATHDLMVDSLKRINNRLTNDIMAIETKHTDLEQAYQKLKVDDDDIRTKHDRLQADYDDLTGKYADLEVVRDNYKTESLECRQNLTESQSEKRDVELELQLSESEKDILERELNVAESALVDLEAKLSQAEKNLEETNGAVEALQGEKQGLKDRLADLTSQNGELHDRLTGAEQSKHDMNCLLDETRAKEARLQGQLDESSAQLEAQLTTIKENEQSLERQEVELHEALSRKEHLMQEVFKFRSLNFDLEKNIREKEQKARDSDRRVMNLQTDQLAKSNEIDRLLGELKEQSDLVSKLDSELEQARAQLAKRAQNTEWSVTVGDFCDFMMEIDPKIEDELRCNELLWELATIAVADKARRRFDKFKAEGSAGPRDMNWYCVHNFTRSDELVPVPPGRPCDDHVAEGEDCIQIRRERHADGSVDLHARLMSP